MKCYLMNLNEMVLFMLSKVHDTVDSLQYNKDINLKVT